MGSVALNIASQIEYVRETNEELVLLQSVLWKRITKSTNVKAISNRPARIPFTVRTGGIARTGDLFDGQNLGRGSAPQITYGTLSAISFLQASEYTALSEYSTDSNEKAIENYVTLTNQQSTETFAGYMDSLVANSAGANELDTVVSTGTNFIVVNNADIFQDNQFVTIVASVGGAVRGTVQIQSIDVNNSQGSTIWLTGAVPAGTIAGDVILFYGSANASNSGVFGIPAYHVAGNSGSYMGIARNAFPGKFSTPNVNPGTSSTATGALTPAKVRAMQAQIDYAMGADAADDDVVAHMGPDMSLAWENNALTVQHINFPQLAGDSSADMLKRKPASTIAGREVLKNVRAIPGRIDFLNLKHWFRLETKATGLYEVGGQSLFPAYGTDGGLASSMLFYLTNMWQAGLGQPTRESFMQYVSIPAGILGH